MLRKLNRTFQDYMRPKRLAFGRWIWDRKEKRINNIDELKENNNLIEDLNIKSILFLRYDGKIGDMVINTLMFREIKKQYPDIKIGVVARGAAKEVIVNNPHVDEIYNYDKSSSKIKELGKKIEGEKYDLLIDFSEMLRVKQMMFINLCKARLNMGIDKKDWNLFDVSLSPKVDFEWTDHITKRYSAYLSILGIESLSVNYDLNFSSEDMKFATDFYSKLPEGKNAVINPYGASKHKTFNKGKLKEIIEIMTNRGYKSILVYSPEKYEELKNFVKELNNTEVYLPEGIKSINHTGVIIEGADLVITPDTSVVHIASALDKPMKCVYPPNGGAYGVDHEVWGPLNKNVEMIFCEDKKSEKDEIDINTFKVEELLKNLNIKI